MLTGTIINCSLEIAAPFLKFGGFQNVAAKISTYALVGSVVIYLPTIYFYGIYGAIASLIFIRFVQGVATMCLMKKHVGISPLGRSF